MGLSPPYFASGSRAKSGKNCKGLHCTRSKCQQVRHYSKAMNGCVAEAFPVFDELEKRGESWNVYQMMLKLSSGTVGKIMLGKDFGHFTSVDAPLHKLVLAMAEILSINKKIASRGQWYAHLPFGDPVRLHNLQHFMHEQIEDSIRTAKASGTEDLPLQDAALKAANVIGKSLTLC